MNYIYRIITTTRTKSGPYQQIQEMGINSLTKDSNIFLKDNEATESFKRTKEWILENYPEYLI